MAGFDGDAGADSDGGAGREFCGFEGEEVVAFLYPAVNTYFSLF